MKLRYEGESVLIKIISVVLPLVAMLMLPLELEAQPADNTLGNHLVGTVLGEAEGLGEFDFRTDADVLQTTDFGFLPNGDMLVADGVQGRILRVMPDGIVHPFAGNGSAINSEDSDDALEVGIPGISHIATDGLGNVYLAQRFPNYSLIRRISPDGALRTIAGKAEAACPTVGASAAGTPVGRVTALTADHEGNIYFASNLCQKVFRIDSDGVIGIAGVDADAEQPGPVTNEGRSVPAASAQFHSVADLAADGLGNVWVAQDSGPNRLALIMPQGVVTFLGRDKLPADTREGPMEEVGYALLESLAAIPGGGVAIAQNDWLFSPQLQRPDWSELGTIDAQGNYSLLLARDGYRGTPSPQFQGIPLSPLRVRVSPTGEIYFRDSRGESIFAVAANGTLTHYFRAFRRAESVVPGAALPTFRILSSTNVVSDLAGNLYIGDRTENKIYRVGTDGSLTHIAGNGSGSTSGDGGSALDAGISVGPPIAIDAEGRIYVLNVETDAATRRIRRFSVDGVIETVLGGGNSPTTEGVDGASVSLEGPNLPWGLAPNGAIYYFRPNESSSTLSDFIWRRDTDGKISRFLGSEDVASSVGLKDQPARGAYLKGIPHSLVVDASGMLFLQPAGNSGVFYVDAEGVVRSLTETDSPNGELVDGTATNAAPWPTALVGPSWSAGGVLTYAGAGSSLVEYRVGGSIRILRKSGDGLLRRDGALFRDDRRQYDRSTIPMSDGGLAWTEQANNYVTVRRSFPVAESCVYTVATELNVSGGNALPQVSLDTGSNCPWTVGSSASWIQILSARTGTGDATIQLRTLANPSPSPRVARVMISGKEVLVQQEPSTRSDLFFLSPSSASAPASGGDVELRIIASAQQQWEISLPDGPIALLGPAGGSGPATVQLRVGALPTGAATRMLTVQVNGVPFRITQMVPVLPKTVVITSTLPGTKAMVDLMERELPYEASWLPGSFHQLSVKPIQAVSENTVRQFRGWSDGSVEDERVVIAPAQNSTYNILSRELHRIQFTSLVNAIPATVTPALSHTGFRFPNGTNVPVPNPTSGYWFEKGSTVSVLAPNWDGVRFVSFSVDLVSTSNPSAITVDGPMAVNINYTPAPEMPPAFRAGGTGLWRFFDKSRKTNPAQVTLTPWREGSGPEPTIFVSYEGEENPSPWLGVRQGADAAPSTFELSIDEDAAAVSTMGRATVYFFAPDGGTAVTYARFDETKPPASGIPWIAAITDAGGFRQSVSDSIDISESFIAAPGMILSMFGQDLASGTAVADSLPLPTILADTVVEYLLSDGSAWRAMPLFFVSPTQINFQVPPDAQVLPTGIQLTLRLRRDGLLYGGPYNITLRQRSASFFTAGSSGFGPPAGYYARLRSSGIQERGPLYTCPVDTTQPCQPAAIAGGGEGEELYLELFGTGFANPGDGNEVAVFLDGKSIEITFAGPHSEYAGLDQLNVKIPNDVRRGVPLDLYLWVRNGDGAWLASNRLTVLFE